MKATRGAKARLINSSGVELELMSHERNSRIRFSKAHECFYLKEQGSSNKARRIRGLRKVMARTFFPDFDYAVAASTATSTTTSTKSGAKSSSSKGDRGGSTSSSSSSSSSNAQKPKAKKKRKSVDWTDVINGNLVPTEGCAKAGVNRGKVTHQELCDYINLSTATCIRKHRKKGFHAFTVQIVEKLVAWGLRPVVAEFNIFDEVLNYATAIDMIVARDLQQTGARPSPPPPSRLVLVETKTGYRDGVFLSGSGLLRLPAQMAHLRIDDSPLHQAMLQVLMARLTLKHRYGIHQTDCVVIHVDENGPPKRYPVIKELLRHEDLIYQFAIDNFSPPNRRAARVPVAIEEVSDDSWNRRRPRQNATPKPSVSSPPPPRSSKRKALAPAPSDSKNKNARKKRQKKGTRNRAKVYISFEDLGRFES